MKKFLFLTLIFASACSTIKVSYDYDKTADFGKYHTYQYTPEALSLPIDRLNSDRLLNAIDSEMAKRGYTKSSPADLLVDLEIKAQNKVDVSATTTGAYGGYGYGGWGPYGYGGGFSTTYVNYDEYVEGTLFISMVDNKQQKLIWQGRGTKTLAEGISPEQREKNINYAVENIFYKYPVKTVKKK